MVSRAIVRVEEQPTQHHMRDEPFFWKVYDAIWYDLMAIKRHTFEFFRGSAIGDWRVRFTTSEVSFGAHLKPLEARSSRNSYAILFLLIGIVILSV